MTPVQLDNWRQFAERMAWESHRWRTPGRRDRVVREVRDLIECFASDWGLEMIGTWDGGATPEGPGRVVQRWGRDHLEIAYPCDDFDRMMEDRGYVHFREWPNGRTEERWTDYASAIICCIRAGFDVAVSPSGGVVGNRYTAGMIRRMFPEGLPAYVDSFFHGPGTKPDAPHFSTLPNDMMVWL